MQTVTKTVTTTNMTTKTIGQQISELPLGKYLNLGKVAPHGSLEARKLSGGVTKFYWRVTLNEKTHRQVIGVYDSSAPPKSLQPTGKGYSIIAATRAAEKLSTQHGDNLEAGGYAGLVQA